ncbi:MAG: hypothetical protein KDJ99_31390, partial [Candidatus Competibacteraceae bacterium]|nr:hypothetical protein [Candidatus Competibacteraceae bacterium]
MSVRCKLLPFFLVLSFSVPAISASPTPSGTLLLIGDVLSFNQRIVWQRIFELSGGDAADIVVIAAAHSRAKLYGGYAQRALSRYGPFVELLPLAVSPAEFNTHYRQAAHNPELVEQVQESNAVFFVGGAPQHLAEVMFSETGSPTPLAMAISQVYAAGGVIVGGIPGAAGAYTDIDAMRVLKQGQVPNNQLYQGLGLLAEGLYADQHFFS